MTVYGLSLLCGDGNRKAQPPTPSTSRAAAGVTNRKKKHVTLERLEKILGISEIVSTTNMHLFDARMSMKKFATPEAILEHFFRHRLHAYHRRKQHLVPPRAPQPEI